MNWTMVSGGTNRNVIPAQAQAAADVRVERIEDYAGLESRISQTIQNQLIPGTQVAMTFEQRRPPLEFNPAQVVVGKHAQKIYSEIGRTIKVLDSVAGGRHGCGLCRPENQKPGTRTLWSSQLWGSLQ